MKFSTKEALEKWICDNFGKESTEEWDISLPPEKEISEKLQSEGWDLDNLIMNGQAYCIDGHTNDGWSWEDEVAPEYKDELGKKGKLRSKQSIHDQRIAAGLSRAEMSRVFEIPLRTLENWESGANNPPKWAEKLVIEKLERLRKDI